MIKVPGKITHAELDRRIVAGELIEINKGFSTAGHLSSFLDGSYGFGSFDARGIGHYFAMESFDDLLGQRMGLNASALGTPQYESFTYAGKEGKTLLRAGLPVDATVATRNELIDEIRNIQSSGSRMSRLGTLRSVLEHNSKLANEESGQAAKNALAAFDNIFRVGKDFDYEHAQKVSSVAAMILGYDASHYGDEGDTAIRLFNKTKLLATNPMSKDEFLEMTPLNRVESRIKGAGSQEKFQQSFAERFDIIKKRVSTAMEPVSPSRLRGTILGSKDTGKSSAKMMPAAPAPIVKSVGKSSAGRSFFDDAVKSASGSKVIKAAGRAIKSIT